MQINYYYETMLGEDRAKRKQVGHLWGGGSKSQDGIYDYANEASLICLCFLHAVICKICHITDMLC